MSPVRAVCCLLYLLGISKVCPCHLNRYYESIVCRMVGETVLRTTFMSMGMCDELDSAMLHAINSVTFNCFHPTLIPVLMERYVDGAMHSRMHAHAPSADTYPLVDRYIERLIQYEPLIGMASLIIAMDVPVVSMHSVMELLNRQHVTSDDDRESMRKFVQDSIDSKNVVRYLGMDGYSNFEGRMPGVCVCVHMLS